MAIDRRELLVLLLQARGPKGMENEPIVGVTRLQKLLYLLKREYGIDKISKNYFSFEPYKFGPYASQLYDDIAFLENLDIIESGGRQLTMSPFGDGNVALPPLESVGEHTASRADMEEAQVSYDYLIGEEKAEFYEEDMQERKFRLTNKGEAVAQEILQQLPVNQRRNTSSKLEEAKKHYGGMTLRQLLGYVYREYPESAIESEIIDKV